MSEEMRPDSVQPRSTPVRKKRSSLPVWLIVLLVTLPTAVIAFFILFVVLLSGVRPREVVLVWDLRSELAERSEADFFQEFLGHTPLDLPRLRRTLRQASTDPRVRGLLLRVGAPQMQLGRIEEIRSLVKSFAETEKHVLSVLESPDTLGYFLATAADEVYLDRATSLHLVGLNMQGFFLGATLDKLGIHADMVRVGEYKGAYEQFVNSEPSPAYLEALDATMASLYEVVVEGIAESRGIDTDTVRELIDGGPYSAARALEVGLVDQLVYRDELPTKIEELSGVAPTEVAIHAYRSDSSSWPSATGRIGLIHVDGLIVDDAGVGLSPLGAMAGAEQVREALRQAREDSSIKGVIVRVNSPGGTLTAAESMWREIQTTKGQMPVVVSMSDTAASGGYYIATAADRIFAHKGTLTGSIGIFGGKMVIDGLLKQFEVGVVTAKRGELAGIYDVHRPFNDKEREAIQRMLQEGYDQFVTRVSEGRNKTVEEIDKLSRGRVWTGEQAVERGLVDAIGGLEDAFLDVCSRAGIDPDASGKLVLLPPPRTLYQLLSAETQRPGYLNAYKEGLLPELFEFAQELKRHGIFDGRHALALLPTLLRLR